ncbi:MAG: hypothetical protein AB7P99_06025 [Vicinamibacterales bacterium]
MQALMVPPALEERLDEVGADALVNMFAVAHENALESFERRLGDECAKLRTEMKVGFADLKLDIIKWSFLFWLGQFAAIAALLTALR